MSPVPFGRRDRLTSAVGPDGSGSNPGSPCTQKPEKSGMAAALSSPLPPGPTAGATAWPKAGVATAAAVMNTKGNFRHCESIAFLLLSLRSAVSPRISLHPLRVLLKDGANQASAFHDCRAPDRLLDARHRDLLDCATQGGGNHASQILPDPAHRDRGHRVCHASICSGDGP